MNTLDWKMYQKNNSLRTWSSQKEEYLSKITSILPLKFDYTNYAFLIPRISFIFYDPAEYWFYVFWYRSTCSEMFFKIGVLKNFTNFTGKHLSWSLKAWKETLAQVFSCEICESFKNTFFYRTPPLVASVARILEGNYVFCCSRRIRLNSTNYLKRTSCLSSSWKIKNILRTILSFSF